MSNGFDLTELTPFERSVINLLRSLSVAAWVTAFLVGAGAVMILLALLGY
jgi:hypothetical protein